MRKSEKDSLTKRELEVVALIIEGYSNSEIANKLSVSLSTAKAHVSSIISKLGAKNRVHTIICAIRCGIIKL